MSWTESLIKLSTFEVEARQKRLGEVVGRRAEAERRLLELAAEGVAEARSAEADAQAGLYHIGFLEGLRVRKAAILAELAALKLEEQGARDALAEAFEDQKKYEHAAEQLRLAAVRKEAKREAAAYDELGLRQARGR